ncbi:MAG TPA: hypothetical protein VIN07_02150 [Flavipsychrobacter sp.]
MIWFDKITDLQYYHQPKDVPCYCEAIAYPPDMFLQGHIYNGNSSYTLKIYVYSADGLVQYEDATSYFDHYFGKVPGVGTHFFNARLKSFSPAMCAHECYVLLAEVIQSNGVVVFNKYTERYCQNNCCDTARNITFEQTGFSPLVINGEDITDSLFEVPGNDVVLAGASPEIFIPAGNCGEQLIRILSKFDCIDKFTGDFYGLPDEVLSGDANFAYRKITSLRGRIVRRPRDIKREISFNCKLQRSESAAQYLVEGFEYLPPWKMYEIEGQLHANRIWVDDFAGVREFQFAGGVAFRQVSKCFELFKLEVTLEDCTQRQIFGCKPGCKTSPNFDGSDKIFALPGTYNGGGFYNSTKQLIANDYGGLLDYFRTRNGVTHVEDVNTVLLNCDVYKVLSVSSNAYVDTHIYYDAPKAVNKVYARNVEAINDLCVGLPAVCAVPVAGSFSVAEHICAIPVPGVFTVDDTGTDEVTIAGFADWELDIAETSGALYNNEVTLSLKVTNETLTEDPEAPGEPIHVGEVIGIIGNNGRPAETIALNNTNSSLPPDTFVTIDPYGRIYYYGLVTEATATDVTIELNNITYNI